MPNCIKGFAEIDEKACSPSAQKDLVQGEYLVDSGTVITKTSLFSLFLCQPGIQVLSNPAVPHAEVQLPQTTDE